MSNDKAVGLIETRGVVALTAAIEAMLKTADVRCLGVERVASGYFAVAVQGSLAAVRQAIDITAYGGFLVAQAATLPADIDEHAV